MTSNEYRYMPLGEGMPPVGAHDLIVYDDEESNSNSILSSIFANIPLVSNEDLRGPAHQKMESTQVVPLAPLEIEEGSRGKQESIFTPGYKANAALLEVSMAAQAIINFKLGNNNLKSTSSNRATLILDSAFTRFQNKLLKANWEAVDSTQNQFIALAAITAPAVGSDIVTYFLSGGEQTTVIGKVGALAIVNALNYLGIMATSKAILRPAYLKGSIGKIAMKKDKAIEALWGKASPARKKYSSGALVGVSAAVAGIANRILVNSDSSVGIIFNIASNDILNKIFKTGRKAEKGTSAQIKLLAFYWFIALGSDVVVGAIIPGGSGVWKFIGATSIGATLTFFKLTAKVVIDHDRAEKKEKKQSGASQSSEKQEETKVSKRWRIGIASLVATVSPIFAVITNQVSAIKNSSTLSVGVKLVQDNLNSLAIREIYLNTRGAIQETAACLLPIGLALGTEYIASTVAPIGMGLIVTGVAVATAATYLGMTVSGKFLPETNDKDDD